MSKRARWNGSQPVEVYPPGDVDAFNRHETLDVVEPGAYLSGDVNQEVHKQLAEGDPRWSLVEYNPPGSKQSGGDKSADKAEEK